MEKILRIDEFYKRIILLWSSFAFLFPLWNSSSFLTPYVIVCTIACMSSTFSFKDKNTRLISLYCASCISALIAMANFEILSIPQAFLVLFSGTILFDSIIQQVLSFDIETTKRKPLKIFLISFIAISATFIIYLFFFNYPGTVTIDSGEQMEQMVSGDYWNHHPVWHTFTMQGIFAIMPGGWLEKVAFFNVIQSLILSAAISYGIMAIRHTKIIIPVILAFVLIPYHMNYAVTLTKDTLFAAGFVVFITSLYFHFYNKKLALWQQILFVASIFPIALYRTNGTVIIAATLLFSLFLLRKKNVLLPMAVSLGICLFLKYPLINILDIAQPDLAESTVMFYQQVGRVVDKGGNISDEDMRLIERIIPSDLLPNVYKEDYADSIKHVIRFRGDALDYYTQHKTEYFDLWKRVGMNNPGLYLEAFVAQTRFWYNSGYDKWVVYNKDLPSIASYATRLVPGLGTVAPKNHPYLNTFLQMKPFTSVGLHTWYLFIFTIVAYIKRDKKILLLIPFLTMLLTLITSAPTMEFRYMYSWFVLLPIIIPMLFIKEKKNAFTCYHSCIQRS